MALAAREARLVAARSIFSHGDTVADRWGENPARGAAEQLGFGLSCVMSGSHATVVCAKFKKIIRPWSWAGNPGRRPKTLSPVCHTSVMEQA
jgi:hypothetical protein